MKSLVPLLVSLSMSTVCAKTKFLVDTATPAIAQAPNVTFSDSLKCGECLLGGYIFCALDYAALASASVMEGTYLPSTICCKDKSTCENYSNSFLYDCASSYTDTLFVQKYCPNEYNACGSTHEVTFTAEGSK
jgi:hypothetical protein